MVTVDDATYVKIKDTLYWGDAWKASRAKGQIESKYTDEQYNDFLSKLDSLGTTKQSTPTSTNNSWPADWYATASERNAATWGSEFISQNTKTTDTPAVVKEETKTEVVETPEVKQQWALKPLDQEYYNQTSQDAQDKIVKNLNDYRQTNPEYFRDYESFKRNFSYDARDDVQKNTLDEWYKWYQDWLTLSSTPTTDLYTQYKNWDLSDAQLQSLRVSDPTKYSELMNQINKWNIVTAYDDDKWMDITWNSIQEMAYQAAQQMFMQWMSGDTDNWATQFFREYEEKMESPEMKWLSDQCTEVQEQIENLQDDIASMKEAVEREYEWTWASRAKINAIIADRTYDLQLQLRTANSEYNKYATQYNNRMQQYQNEFQLWLQEYQINQQARQQQMQELWFAMDLMSFETPQQQQERQWEFWLRQQEYQDGNINSKDPAVQLKAIQNSVDSLLENYAGISTIRSSVEIAQDIQTAIKNGSSLGAELTTLNKQMQSKPEYKLMYNATYNWKKTLGTINWKSAIITYDAAGNYTWYELLNTEPDSISSNNRSQQIKSFEDVWAVSGNDWNTYMANLENAVQLGSWGWQCGAWANDILSWAWGSKVFWNSLADKIKVCDNKFGANASNDYSRIKTWDFVVLDTWAKLSDWTPAGHVGVIKSIDLHNWTITVFDTNGQAGKECWGESTYKLSVVRGTYDPMKQANNFTKVDSDPDFTSEWQTALASWTLPSDTTNMSQYDMDTLVMRIGRTAYGATISDNESKRVEGVIKNWAAQGKNQTEILWDVLWYTIDSEDKDMGNIVVDKLQSNGTKNGLSDYDMVWLASQINQWNYWNAIMSMEKQIAKNTWNTDMNDKEALAVIAATQWDELISQIKDNMNKLGIVEWNVNSWKRKLKRDEEGQQIASRLTSLVTDWRKEMAWSNVTDRELKMIDELLPSIKDNPYNAITKIEEFQSYMLKTLNSTRSVMNLPNLDGNTLMDKNARANLYLGNYTPSNNTVGSSQNSWYDENWVNRAAVSKVIDKYEISK